MGAQLTPKMTSDDDSPKQWCDRHVKLYTYIHFIGPLDLVLKASRVYSYNGGIYDNTMSVFNLSNLMAEDAIDVTPLPRGLEIAIVSFHTK